MTSLFGHSVRSDVLLLYVADALLCFMAVSALLVWQVGLPFTQGVVTALSVAAACGIISGASGLYHPAAFGRARKLVVATAVAGLLLLILLPVINLVTPAEAGLGSHLLGVTLAFTAAVITTRLGFTAALRSGRLANPVAILRNSDGSGPDLAAMAAAEASSGRFRIATELSDAALARGEVTPAKLRHQRIRAIIAAEPGSIPAGVRRDLEATGIQLVRDVEFLEHQLARVDIARLSTGWVARSNGAREAWAEAVLRRAVDILLGSFLLLATLPLIVVTAVAIRLDSPGPVFYRQERVGRDGRVFTLFKFRSMRVDAEAAGAPIWASRRDDRVTRVGRLIRLTRIDEIPQVLNVLRGDMAFVGPRPERPAFVEKLGGLIPHYHDRAIVKPGITGWAQVNYPYGASVDDARMKLAYDLYYVRRRSLFLDLLILVATVRVVLFQEGSR